MRCQQAMEMISRWVDGELAASDQDRLEKHVGDCLTCQQELETAKQLQYLLRASDPRLELSPDFSTRFWQKVGERAKQPWPARIWEETVPIFTLPRFSQLVAAWMLALVIGGVGGFVGTQYGLLPLWTAPPTIYASLSGFEEYKGLPIASLAGTYLIMMRETDEKTESKRNYL